MALNRGFLKTYLSVLDSFELRNDVLMLGNHGSRVTSQQIRAALRSFGSVRVFPEPGPVTLETLFTGLGAASYLDIDLFGSPGRKVDLSAPLEPDLCGRFD